MNSILFPVTYDCNLNCEFCTEKAKRGNKIDIAESIKKIISLQNEWVFISGGEPLLVETICEICDTLRSAGKKVGLTTNGTINKTEIAYHVDRLGVSIDGDEEMHDKYRGQGSYSKAVKFLEVVIGKTETAIMTVLLNDTREKAILSVRELGRRLGVDYVQFVKDKYNA